MWVPILRQNLKVFRKTIRPSEWDDITVPSVWQLYGVRNGKNGSAAYVNVRYPFTYDEDYSVMADRPQEWTYNNDRRTL